MGAAGWRPPGWTSQAPLWSVTVVNQQTTQVNTRLNVEPNDQGIPTDGPSQTTTGNPNTQSQSTVYYFDAVLASDHFTGRRFTDHPIQSGSSVTDHSYQLPDRVVLSVGFSDAMQAYSVGQYGNGSSKSVSAYQTFVNLQKTGQQVQLATRLNQYPVMGIEEIRATDSVLTSHAARFIVVFKQLITAQVSTTTVQSARADQSQQTPTGTNQSTSVPPATLSSHTTTSSADTPPSAPNVPNPNPNWSSDAGVTP